MTPAAPRHVAIWIDTHQALLVAFEADPLDRSITHRPGDGWSQYRVDAQQHLPLQQYYDAPLSYLEPQDEILILGPGQAKRELRQRIEQHGGPRGTVVGVHDAASLADVELVIPTGEIWHSEKAGTVQVDSLISRPVLALPPSSKI
jgi:hypothetical protein